MKIIAPFHIRDYCLIAEQDSTYKELFNEYQDNYHFVYKIRCSCCNDRFKVYKDEHPTVLVKCLDCEKEIVVYDLKYYPAAVKLDVQLNMNQIISQDSSVFNVYSIYEYSDEAENDIGFDENDITWCIIFIKDITDNKLIEVINDETA